MGYTLYIGTYVPTYFHFHIFFAMNATFFKLYYKVVITFRQKKVPTWE